MTHEADASPPTIEEIRQLQARLSQWLVRTPVLRCRNLEYRFGGSAELYAKLEFLQQTGTFKTRGALSAMLRLDSRQLKAGVTAVSAGNHAIATAFAARAVGTSAKVVMVRTASPVRIAACRGFGAEIVLADDVHQAFDIAESIRLDEGRFFVHPFEGRPVTTGTATIGLEICEQVDGIDVIVVPVGGGGLCAGIASAAKQINPGLRIIGVEPRGADTMHRSFASGRPEKIDRVSTIADSLGAPFALPYSLALCQRYVDQLVRVSDDELRSAMRMLYEDVKIAIEPACAATTAALFGPLREQLDGKKVVLVFCGSNIDWTTFENHIRPD